MKYTGKAETFIDVLGASGNKPKRMPLISAKPLVTDINEIKKFMTKKFPE